MTEEEYAETECAKHLTYAEFRAAVDSGRDMAHRREYESAIADRSETYPTWEALTEEQRESIRRRNELYWEEMRELGVAIGKGTFG